MRMQADLQGPRTPGPSATDRRRRGLEATNTKRHQANDVPPPGRATFAPTSAAPAARGEAGLPPTGRVCVSLCSSHRAVCDQSVSTLARVAGAVQSRQNRSFELLFKL